MSICKTVIYTELGPADAVRCSFHTLKASPQAHVERPHVCTCELCSANVTHRLFKTLQDIASCQRGFGYEQ